jgi:hypothetical protein
LVLIKKLKFKKLLNEYKSLKYELELIREMLKDGHLEFEVFYRQWCAENDVDLAGLQKSNQKRVDVIFEKQEAGLVKPEAETKGKASKHKKVFREIARKIHPDKLESSDPRYWEFNNAFKKATSAMDNQQWGDLFEVADEFEVFLGDYDEVYSDLEGNIEEVKSLIENEKKSYSYSLLQCENDEACKEKVVRSFLWQLFKWK